MPHCPAPGCTGLIFHETVFSWPVGEAFCQDLTVETVAQGGALLSLPVFSQDVKYEVVQSERRQEWLHVLVPALWEDLSEAEPADSARQDTHGYGRACLGVTRDVSAAGTGALLSRFAVYSRC